MISRRRPIDNISSLYNGGGPGVLYGLIAACIFYAFIAAGLAELASAIPSSGNVYHWASVTAGKKYGRICSFYAGWWNCLAWIFGAATSSLFAAQTVLAMYSIYHPNFEPQRWQFFIVYVIVTWCELGLVLYGQKFLARAATGMGTMLMLIFICVTLVCAIMPSQTGYGYASNKTVWAEWQNLTGWSSNGLVFVLLRTPPFRIPHSAVRPSLITSLRRPPLSSSSAHPSPPFHHKSGHSISKAPLTLLQVRNGYPERCLRHWHS